MTVEIKHLEPVRLPAPYTEDYGVKERTRLKQLGISPAVDNGIRVWRVIWRPYLDHPIHFRYPDGTPGIKEKADNVCTRRFTITGTTTEEQAFMQASLVAAAAYRAPVSHSMPIVDWDRMARAKGVKLRRRYAKPALNGDMDRALRLFEEGYGPRQVGEILGVHPSTASRWRTRLRKEKALL